MSMKSLQGRRFTRCLNASSFLETAAISVVHQSHSMSKDITPDVTATIVQSHIAGDSRLHYAACWRCQSIVISLTIDWSRQSNFHRSVQAEWRRAECEGI